jgi:hypothetical protein
MSDRRRLLTTLRRPPSEQHLPVSRGHCKPFAVAPTDSTVIALSIRLARFVECISAAKRNSLVKGMLAFYVVAATFLCVSNLHRENCDH